MEPSDTPMHITSSAGPITVMIGHFMLAAVENAINLLMQIKNMAMSSALFTAHNVFPNAFDNVSHSSSTPN